MAESDSRATRAERFRTNSITNLPKAKPSVDKLNASNSLHLASAPSTREDPPMRYAPASVKVEAHPDMTIVVAAGDIDLYTAPQLLNPLLEIAGSPGGAGVVLDLRGVSFMDSVGMRALISAHKSLRNAERQFALLTIPRSQPDRQISLMGLDRMIDRVTQISDIPWSSRAADQSDSLAA